MKSAMQQLIDYVNSRPLTQTGENQFAQVIPYGEVVNLATELLEIEREQLENEYDKGYCAATKDALIEIEKNYIPNNR